MATTSSAPWNKPFMVIRMKDQSLSIISSRLNVRLPNVVAYVSSHDSFSDALKATGIQLRK